MKLSTVIFDIGCVLVSCDWKSYLHSFGFDKDTETAVANAIFWGPYWKEVDRGVWSDGQILDAFTSLAPSYRHEIELVYAHADRSISGLSYARPWIQDLKSRGLGIYYLSNYPETIRMRTTEALNFLDLMDGGLFSYEVKQIKPEKPIYLELMRRYPEILPEQSVFIDDSEANIITARELGIHGIVFRNQAQAISELEKLL